MGKKVLQLIVRFGSFLFFLVFLILSWQYFDLSIMSKQLKSLIFNYEWLVILTISYLLAFVMRAMAWKWYRDVGVPFKIYLYALFYSLLFNHLLPVKVGDLIRVGVLAKEKQSSWDTAMHTVIMMRIIDLVCLAIFASIGAVLLSVSLIYSIIMAVLIVMAILGGLALLYIIHKKPPFLIKHIEIVKEAFYYKKSILIFGLVAISWILEAVVVLGVIQSIQYEIPFWESIWVNSITITSQVFQFAPGGLGTYESTMSFALAQIGFSWQDAYHIAIITHAYKFLFSFLVGGITYMLHPISASQLIKWRRQKGETT
jgi:uncharacterized membrane protein YbhN (UPF0104 family)